MEKKSKKVVFSEDGRTLVRVPRDFEGEFVIPEGVISLENGVFRGCEKLTHVVFPYSLTKISRSSFVMSGLTEIEIPNYIEVIENGAFAYCKKSSKVILHNGIKEIGENAFLDCTIKEIVIPKSVVYIHPLAFEGCPIEHIVVEEGNPKYDSRENCNAIIETATNTLVYGCKNTKIPQSVSVIGECAFYRCLTLENIFIPKSVTMISKDAFRRFGTLSFESIVVEEGNPTYDSRDNCNAIIETNTNRLIVGCSNTVVPTTVTTIGEAAFEFCQLIVKIDIPDNVIDIESHAFYGCRNMEYIRLPKGLKRLADGIFAECYKLNNVSLPEGLEAIEGKAFTQNSSLTHIDIPSNVKSVSGFSSCPKLKHITIPENVQKVGKMFAETKLKSISVDERNTKFDSRENCNAIIETETNTLIRGCASTVIPKSVEHIASQAFWFCVDLREISIPEGVKTIGKRAFVGCEKLRKVVLPVTLENIEEDELWGGVFDSYVKQIIIPRGHKERFMKMGLKQYEEVIIEQ